MLKEITRDEVVGMGFLTRGQPMFKGEKYTYKGNTIAANLGYWFIIEDTMNKKFTDLLEIIDYIDSDFINEILI